MNNPESNSRLVKFRRLPAPENCSFHAAIFAEEGLRVTPYTVEHYARLWGRHITEIRFESYGGEVLPVLKLSGGLIAAVYCDPEGNAPGHLGTDWET